MFVSLYKDEGEKIDCKNSKDISLLSVVRKIYGEVLVDRLSKVTGWLVHEEREDFKPRRGWVHGITEFNGTEIQKPFYYFEIDLTIWNFLTIYLLWG